MSSDDVRGVAEANARHCCSARGILLLQFSPKLPHVAAAFEQASIEISSLLVNRVRKQAQRSFREGASSIPSLHCAQAEIELPRDIGLAYTVFHQSSHLFIEIVTTLPLLVLDCEGLDRDLLAPQQDPSRSPEVPCPLYVRSM